MARFRLLDRVHGERADGVRHAIVLGARQRRGSFAGGGPLRGGRGDGEGRFRAGHGGAKRLLFRGSSTRARGVKDCWPWSRSPFTGGGTSSARALTGRCDAT